MNTIERIESSQYLYLLRIEEPEDNALKIVIQEARASAEGNDLAVSGAAFTNVHPIVSDNTCPVWEIAFTNYIAYSVRNESYTVLDDAEERTGRLFCVYTKSKFIDYVRAATIASDDYPGAFRHYGINCLNHTIDVISVAGPAITQIQGNDAS